MTKEEYDLALNAASTEYDNKRRQIIREYALSNNPHNIGDRITDHIGTIEIKEIKAHCHFGGIPECVYIGVQYNKDGKLSKKQDHTKIYQSNILN